MTKKTASITFGDNILLSENTVIYRLANGTIIYRDIEWNTLYDFSRGIEVKGDLPENIISGTVFENALYFKTFGECFSDHYGPVQTAPDQIFKVVLTASNSLKIECIRNIAKDEKHNEYGVCWRVSNGKMYLSRICDDPYIQAICVQDESASRRSIVHHGRLITLKNRRLLTRPRIVKRSEKGFSIELPSGENSDCFADHASSFVYFVIDRAIHTLNTMIAEFLPSLQITNKISDISIAGVFNGEMTIRAALNDEEDSLYKMYAQLPDGYFVPHMASCMAPGHFQSDFEVREINDIGRDFENSLDAEEILKIHWTVVGVNATTSEKAALPSRVDDETNRASQSLNGPDDFSPPTIRKYVRRRKLENIDDNDYLEERERNKLVCRETRRQKMEYDFFLQSVYDSLPDPKPTPAGLGLPIGFACGSDGKLKPFEVTKRQKDEWKKKYGALEAFK